MAKAKTVRKTNQPEDLLQFRPRSQEKPLVDCRPRHLGGPCKKRAAKKKK